VIAWRRPTAAEATSAVLALLLLAEIGTWTNRWRDAAAAAVPSDRNPPAPSLESWRSPSAVAAEIAAAHLFGKAGEPSGAEATQLVASRASYALRGTIATGGSGSAIAIVALNDATQSLFRPGDSLPDGARLHRVELLGIVIERAGTFEWLPLPQARTAAPERIAARANAPEPGSGPDSASVARGEALTELELHVARDGDGRVVGLLPNSSRWTAAGLRGGDVITAIDGVPVARLVSDRFTLTRLAAQKTARLTVQRGAGSVTLQRVAMR
jgi:S1-C subfamily serine protease